MTSSPPCWLTKTKDLSLASFVRPPEDVHFYVVIGVSRGWLKTSYKTSFPGSSLFLPRESTLVAAGHVPMGGGGGQHYWPSLLAIPQTDISLFIQLTRRTIYFKETNILIMQRRFRMGEAMS